MRKTKLPIVEGEYVRGESINSYGDAWQQWLKNPLHRSFRYIGQNGMPDITVRNRNGNYWYAYRRHFDKQATFYLGRTEEVNFSRLQQASEELQNVAAYNNEVKERVRQKKSEQEFCTLTSQDSKKCTEESLYNSQQAVELQAENASLKNQIAQLQEQLSQLAQLEAIRTERDELQQWRQTFEPYLREHKEVRNKLKAIGANIKNYDRKNATALREDIEAVLEACDIPFERTKKRAKKEE